MSDLYIDFAGGKGERHPIRRSLARMRGGDAPALERDRNGKVRVMDHQDVEVARLSSAAARKRPRTGTARGG